MYKRKNLTVREWNATDRPREKLIERGPSSLTDTELLAILLQSGSQGESVVELARRLLKTRDDNLDSLSRMTVMELSSIRGIGTAKAATIVASFELGRRRMSVEKVPDRIFTTSNSVYDYCSDFLMDIPHEEFHVLMLNRANALIKRSKISQGGISSTSVDIRLIMKEALENLSSGIILVHNHPSGNPTPSKEDINVTLKVKRAAELFGISLLDHVIVAGREWFSFAETASL